MATAIVWRSYRSDTGSPDERSFSTLGPKIAFSSSALLVFRPFIKAAAAVVRVVEARPVRRRLPVRTRAAGTASGRGPRSG